MTPYMRRGSRSPDRAPAELVWHHSESVRRGACMLIAVAGSIGAGKSTVARAIANELRLPLVSIDDDKRAEGATTTEFEGWVSSGTPFPDWFRARAFDRTVRRLASMVGEHPHAIVEETFHRKAIRDTFFDEAAQLMDGLLLVEVVAAEATVLARLERRATREADHLAGAAMYQAFLGISDAQDRTDYLFPNDGDFDAEVERCCRFLREQLDEPSPVLGES